MIKYLNNFLECGCGCGADAQAKW